MPEPQSVYMAATIERGGGFDWSRELRDQVEWDAHAAFMDDLAERGTIVLGGPIGDGTRVMLIFDVESEEDVHAVMARDPWAPLDVVRVGLVQPWQIFLRAPA